MIFFHYHTSSRVKLAAAIQPIFPKIDLTRFKNEKITFLRIFLPFPGLFVKNRSSVQVISLVCNVMSQNRVIHISETNHMSKSPYGDIALCGWSPNGDIGRERVKMCLKYEFSKQISANSLLFPKKINQILLLESFMLPRYGPSNKYLMFVKNVNPSNSNRITVVNLHRHFWSHHLKLCKSKLFKSKDSQRSQRNMF